MQGFEVQSLSVPFVRQKTSTSDYIQPQILLGRRSGYSPGQADTNKTGC